MCFGGENLAVSKYITGVGLVVMLLVGFGIGIIVGPMLIQPSTSEDPIWDDIMQRGVIRIGTDPTWPPYQYLDDNNNIIGFEVDIANAIAAELGVAVEWRSEGFDTIVASVAARTLDLGVSGFSVNAERLEKVKFTMPHSITRGQVIMLESRRDELDIEMLDSLTDLRDLGLTVGTQQGTTEQDELLSAGISRRDFSDFGAAISDMVSSNPSIDCVYAETPITSSWIGDYEDKGIDIVVIFDIPYYPVAFVANKDANTFVAKMDGVLADMIASGKIDELRDKWNA
jgi:ABC-type amino acid transport substrate-binding protein